MTPSAWIANQVLHAPRRILTLAMVGVALCAALAATLRVDSSRHSMVRASDPHQARQLAYFDAFGFPNTLVVVIGGGHADQRRDAALAMEAALRTDPAWADRTLTCPRSADVAPLLLLSDNPLERLVESGPCLTTPDGAHHLLLLFPEVEGTQQAHEVEGVVAEVRAVRDAVLADAPALQADVTGVPALVVDEQREIALAVATTSGVTALGIVLCLVLGLRSLRLTAITLVPVVCGVLVGLATARVAWGELNMVTSSCSSILLGLGVDFGVYVIRRFQTAEAPDLEQALRATLRRAGAATAIGALTTSAAFLAIVGVPFTAFARLGLIVSVGLFGTLLAALFVVPVLLFRGARRPAPVARAARVSSLLSRRTARAIAAAALALSAASLIGARAMPFDTRFYDFLPAHVESARALGVVEAIPSATPLRANAVAGSLEEARELTAALRELESVGEVWSAAELLPALDEEERARLERRVERSRLIPGATMAASREVARGVLERQAYSPDDLPPLLRRLLVSRDGQRFALDIVPSRDLWEPANAARFYDEVSAVAPDVTGLAVSVHVHLGYIRDGFMRAGAVAGLLILLVVGVLFRSLRDGLWTLAACTTTFVWMAGGMTALGLGWNAANMVALPLILGVSIDAAVHVLHHVREHEARGEVLSVGELAYETGAAALLAGVTTLVGFAGLMAARYGALDSLGATMAVGLVASLAVNLVLLPAALFLRGRLRAVGASRTQTSPA